MPDAVTTQIQNLLAHGQFLTDVSQLLDAGLLEGISSTAQTKFQTRLHAEREQKKQLAQFALNECGLEEEVRRFEQRDCAHRPSKIFFESGSTIAYIIGRFAQRIRAARPVSGAEKRLLSTVVLTNNVLAIPALAGLVENVEPIQGRFEATYYGFMPFRERPPALDDSDRRKQEILRFDRLAGDIFACDRVFATCTEFSLLAGPLVGTRQNALTKRALAEGMTWWSQDDRQVKRYYMFFHFNKLLPLATTSQNHSGALKLLGKTESDEHYSVFQPLDEAYLIPLAKRWREGVELWKGSEGTQTDPPKLTWHARYMATMGKDVLDAIDYLDKSYLYFGQPAHKLSRSWLEAGTDARLAIALPERGRKEALDALVQEVSTVNQLLHDVQYPRRYMFGFERLQKTASTEMLENTLRTGVVPLAIAQPPVRAVRQDPVAAR